MKKFISIVGLMALTIGSIACSSQERVVRESTEKSYSSTVTAAPPPPPPTVQERTTVHKQTTITAD